VAQLLVTGQIDIPDNLVLPARSVAYVRLLDTSIADASSIEIAEVCLTDIASKVSQGKPIDFELYGEPPNPRASYNVSAHIDVDHSGHISAGDYITVQSYPVITYGYPRHVVLEVKKV
jgi:uncharacterized lipoprotein YbaY